MLTGMYHYDMAEGLIALGRVLFLLCLVVSIRYSLFLIRTLDRQDKSILGEQRASPVSDIFSYYRKFIIFLIGYRGEERELTKEKDVDFRWMRANWYQVLKRFFVFYSVYITFGIILTRPIYFSKGDVFFYHYDRNNLKVFSYLLIYIATSSIFDYLSILFTLKNISKIIETGKIFYYGFLGLLNATCCFVPSQLISCLLWYLKRAETNVVYSDNYLFNLIDITLWPYGVVGNADTNTVVGPLFPGQLVITGTVFLPTILMLSTAILYYVFLEFAFYLKRFLVFVKFDNVCKVYLKISLSNVWSIPDGSSFGYCNTALILMLNGFLISFFYDQIKSLIAAFL